MNRADVAAVDERGVVQEARAIGLFHRGEPVEQAGEQFALRGVTLLRGVHPLAGLVVAHVVWGDIDAQTLEQRADWLPVGDHPRGVGLERGDQDVVHHLDLVFAGDALFGGAEAAGRRGLGHGQPLFLLGEPRLDVANRLEVFVEFVGVGRRQTPPHPRRIGPDGVEHALFGGQGRLPFLKRRAFSGEEPVEGEHWRVEAGQRATAGIPGQRQPRPVARVSRVERAELKRSETRLVAPCRGSHLVGGYGVRKALARLAVAVGTGEPERAPPVGFVCELIGEPLDHRELVAVPLESFQSLWQRIVLARLFPVGKPGLVGHAPAEAEEHHSLGPSGSGSCRGPTAKAQRVEERQRDGGAGSLQDGATAHG